MKFVQSTGSQASVTRRTALLWLLLVVGIALNCRLILRRRILGDDRSLPIPDGRDRPGSVNDPNNDIVSDTGEAGGSVDSGGARRGGVLGDDVQSGPPRSRSSRKEGGDSTGLLGDDVGGGWTTSAKRLEADARGECLFTSNSNSPGVPDLYSYVEAYWDSMVKTRMVATLEEASKMYVRVFALFFIVSPFDAHSLGWGLLSAQAGVDDRGGYGERGCCSPRY
jgi:hypothetical protein